MESKKSSSNISHLARTSTEMASTLPSEKELDWDLFCRKFSDMFDSEKSKQQAMIVLQQIQKHTNQSLTSSPLRIEH